MAFMRRNFGLFGKIFGKAEKEAPTLKSKAAAIAQPLAEHKAIEIDYKTPKIQVSTLKNGLKILTESSSFPAHIHLGAIIDVGVREENNENSGALMGLKHTYLTNTSSDEIKNFSMLQMSGGELAMDYDQEQTLFQGYCMSYDVADYLQLIKACLRDQRSQEDQEKLKIRLEELWKLREASLTNELRLMELTLDVAYGKTGVGMPLHGSKNSKLTLLELNHFSRKLTVPEKTVLFASGVRNHQEFEDLANQYFGDLQSVSNYSRAPSPYIGGEHREICETEITYMSLSFKGASWTDQDMVALHILKTAIGEAGIFKSGLNLGKGLLTRSHTSFLDKGRYLLGIRCINMNFSDTGIFGIMLAGVNSHTFNMSNDLIAEFQNLPNISEEEISRAKNLLKTQILYLKEQTGKRLEDAAKMYLVLGKTPDKLDWMKMIDNVTSEQVREAARRVAKTKPTLVVLGTPSQVIPKIDEIAERVS